MVQVMKENLWETRYKDMDSISGQMEGNTKDIGSKIKCLVMVFSNGQTVESIRGVSKRISIMGKVYALGLMGKNTLEIGKTISSMVLDYIRLLRGKKGKVNGIKANACVG